MKKVYIKPQLGTKQYAQFENVYAGCSKDTMPNGCKWDATYPDSPRNIWSDKITLKTS